MGGGYSDIFHIYMRVWKEGGGGGLVFTIH